MLSNWMFKLTLPSFAAPTVQLVFSSQLTKLKAEKFRAHILQAFESVLGSQVTLEIRSESNKETSAGLHLPLIPASVNAQNQMAVELERRVDE